MKPKPRSEVSQRNLFQAQFEQLLNLNHPLCVLVSKIDWKRCDVAFASCYCPETGALGKEIRLLVGLHYLNHAFNESAESLLDRWGENPYWQYFYGFKTIQHEVPLHSTSLMKWRQRVGAERLLVLLEETPQTSQCRGTQDWRSEDRQSDGAQFLEGPFRRPDECGSLSCRIELTEAAARYCACGDFLAVESLQADNVALFQCKNSSTGGRVNQAVAD